MTAEKPTSDNNIRLSPESKFYLNAAAMTGVMLLGAGAIASAENSANNQNSHDLDASKSYTELAAESAKQSYDPSKDTLVINGIKVMPGDSKRNSPSQAVLNHPEVEKYMNENPDDVASLEASSLSLNALETDMAIVERDIDADGDGDAVAVPVVK